MSNDLNTFGLGPRHADRARARRLGDLLHECAGSAACGEADRVHDALQLAIATTGGVVRPDPKRTAELLGCGAALQAVIELLGPKMPFMLSRGPAENCLATVVSPGSNEEVMGEGRTPALALLGAYLGAELASIETTRGAGDTAGAASPLASSFRLH